MWENTKCTPIVNYYLLEYKENVFTVWRLIQVEGPKSVLRPTVNDGCLSKMTNNKQQYDQND